MTTGRIAALAFTLLYALVTNAEEVAADRLAVAGKLELDYHAAIMVALDTNGYAVNWNNCGLFMGCFGDFGFDGPRANYPKYSADLAGSPAIVFSGTTTYRHFPSPATNSICDGTLSVEVWAKDVKGQDGSFISWDGFSIGPKDFALGADDKWHHLAAVVASNEATYYRDGACVGTKTIGPMTSEQIHIGDKLVGAVAAIRVHNEAMTPAQIGHNIKGGVMLGTKFFVNINTNDPNDVYFNDPNLPGWKTVYSPHFRSSWELAKDEKQFMEERVPKQLEEAEHFYKTFEQLGYHLPIVSADIELRGDGRKYLIPAGNDWGLAGGGGWMGWSRGYGFSIAGPGWFSGHELGHGTQGEQLRGLAGGFWEVHASWLDSMSAKPQPEPVGVFMPSAHLFPGNGRNYYHTWQMFDHLSDTPEYGPLFMTKLWNAGSLPRDNYPWKVGEEIDPDHSTPFRDELVKMARKCITWDFAKRDAYTNGAASVDLKQYRTIIEPVAYKPGWYRVPRSIAPLQWGFNICPLKATGPTVTADLQGYKNPERGSHWSASFVAVQTDGSPRYSDVWNEGVMTFDVKPDDKELYLVVAATPTKIASLPVRGDYRSPDWSQFPYCVKLDGAAPREVLFRDKPAVPGKPHSNGGGFVADTAKVDPTAYVGEDAQVLSNAQVLGNARIEDSAVVFGIVKDNAVVSDFAKVEKDTTVRGNAKIRGRAVVGGGCDISGDAKVLENATVAGNSTKVSGYVTIKGNACAYNGNVRGTGMLDGHYAKGNDISKGCWFTWSWGAGKNDGEVDEEFGGVYCQYTFETNHPYLAWDEHGVTWGYLVGGPKVEKQQVNGKESNVLVLDGTSQFVELQPDCADMRDITISMDVKWEGNKGATLMEFTGRNGERMILSPSDSEGKLSFSITENGKTQTVSAPKALPEGAWANVQVMLGEDTATLLVDGKEVGRNDAFTFNPDDMRAVVGYLGRGKDGGYFKGSIDNFTIYGLALNDKVAPTPNPSEWLFAPAMPSPTKTVMHMVEASDPRGVVEYKFTETSGNPGGMCSGWQKEPTFVATNLQPGVEYEFEAVARDVNGNVTKPAQRTKVKWHNPQAFCQDDTEAGVVVFEAEHPNRKDDGPAPYKWELVTGISNCTKGETAMQGLPDTGIQYTPFFGPRLDYNVKLKKPGTYWLWLRASGPHWRGDSVNIAFDFQTDPQTPYIDLGVDKFRWVRYNQPFTVTEPGVHTLTIWMREDGTLLDRLLLTCKEEYKPSDELDSFKAPVGIGPAANTKE